MRLRMVSRSVIVALAWLALLPAVARAQSAIAGVVKDTSGAIMPGVTVEASSPALIEQIRAVATDEQGQYKIVDLRPGIYSVTFTLPGFATSKREGIDLPSNFTAQINGEMKVGELSETLTVTGGAPVVDVQSATSQQVMPQRLLDSMPTGGRSYQSVGATLVGVAPSSPDVGGSQGMQQSYLNAHGSDPRDNAVLVEGVRLNSMEGNGANQNYFNEGMFAEMAYQTGGVQVETSSGGIRLNLIPKDGGNQFKGDVFYSATSSNLQANPAVENGDPRQRAANAMDTMHDLNISVGGPVKRDRLWFFASIRHWGVNQTTANSFYPATSTLNTFTPDTTRQVLDDNLIKSEMTRLTWQVSAKNKLSGYIDHVSKWRGHEQSSGGGVTGALWSEDSFGVRTPKAYFSGVIKWTGTWTSKVLFEAGVGMNNKSVLVRRTAGGAAGDEPDSEGGHRDRHLLGRSLGSLLSPKAGPPQRDRGPFLRDRFSRRQVRDGTLARVEQDSAVLREPERELHRALLEYGPELGRDLQHAERPGEPRQPRHRVVSPGHVHDQPAHADARHPLRVSQRFVPRTAGPGKRPEAPPARGLCRAGFRRAWRPAQLEELESADWRRLRRVRRREDGGEGVVLEVPGVLLDRFRAALQPDERGDRHADVDRREPEPDL